jgi:hypothetical protein
MFFPLYIMNFNKIQLICILFICVTFNTTGYTFQSKNEFQENAKLCLEIARNKNATPQEIQKVKSWLFSDSPDLSSSAAIAIRELGLINQDILARLTRNLDSKNERIISSAALALVSMGDQGRSILLKRIDSEPTLEKKMEALVALRSIPSNLNNQNLRKKMDELLPLMEKVFYPDPETSVPSLLTNHTFTKTSPLADWTFHQGSNATGSVKFDANASRRTGSGSLKLSKTNSEGEIYLRSKLPIKVTKGTEVLVRVYFRSDNSPTSSMLQILFEDENGKLNMGSDRFAWESQTLLRNAPPGKWEKRLVPINAPDKDQSYHIRITLRGNPSDVWIDDIAVPATNTALAFAAIESLPEENLSAKPIKSIPPATGSIEKINGRTRMVINNKPTPPVLYYTMRANHGDFAGMEQLANVNLQTVSVQLNETDIYRGAQPVWANGQLDFTTPLERIAYAANSAPDSYLFLSIRVGWPQDWIDKNPDDTWQNIKRERGYGTQGHFKDFGTTLPKDQFWWPSPFSEKAIKDAQDVIHKLIAEIKKTPYFNRIVGCHIAGGHDGQFSTRNRPDYSPAAQKAFRVWLKNKYKTTNELQKHWKDNTVTFETAEVPDYKPKSTIIPVFFDPSIDYRIADHSQFQSEQGMVLREEFAKAFKEAMGKPVIGMAWAMAGGSGQGTETIFMNSKNLDVLIPQPAYPRRLPGLLGGLRYAPLGSYRENNKMIIKELDSRTYLRSHPNEGYAQRVSSTVDPKMFTTSLRKEAAQMLSIGQGYWMFDIGKTHFRDPLMLEDIAKSVKAYNDLELKPKQHYKPEVAIVWVDQSGYWLGNAFGAEEHNTGFGFLEMGFPFDDLYLSDILKKPALQNYKMYIFKDAWKLTEEQRNQIKQKLQNGNKTLVWNYAPGYIGDDKFSVDYIHELTGIKNKVDITSEWPKVRYSGNSPLTKGLSGIMGMGEIDATQRAKGELPNKRKYQRFIINDPAATTIASYQDGKAAAAIKEFPTWTSVYSGMVGTMDPFLLARLAKDAGVHCITKPGNYIEFNGTFLSIHGMRNEPVTISLPQASIVTDFDTNQQIAKGSQFTMNMVTGETKWLKITPIK